MADTATDLAVITPSYAPDIELCTDLNESVLRNTPESVKHYIVIPKSDVRIFSRLCDARTEVLCVDDMLPRHVLPVPGANFWLNIRHPLPPVRGWVMQQVIKLQMARYVNADLLLLIDSDVVLVRPVTRATFMKSGQTRFYRQDNAIHSGMARHVVWYDVACKLLGVPSAPPPLPDYVCVPTVWERSMVLALCERIQEITGRHWLDVAARQMHFSECMLYGVFVDKVVGARANVASSGSMLCHNYYETVPLDVAEAEEFIGRMPASDVAVMISAKSGTPLEVRRKALARLV